MIITLPPRRDAQPLTVDTAQGTRQLVIIGANGSGKTRFARRLMQDFGPKAYKISAINAIFDRGPGDTTPEGIDSRYRAAANAGSLLRSDLPTQWERLMALLMTQEMKALIFNKWGEGTQHTSPTPLDRVINLWQRVFPQNQVLVETGRMLFSREGNQDIYRPELLSAGEKAVLYYIAAAISAPRDALVVVDAPEMFLHPSKTRSLWDLIEAERSDCTWVYVTHDLSFPSTRTSGTTVWVKGYDPEKGQWDYDLLSDHDGISEDLYLALIGARKPVLFIEGDEKNSYDSKFYPLIFSEYSVKPLGGCDRVIEATRAFNGLKAFHNLDAAGIVDRDRRSESEVSSLRERKIFVPNVAEIENIFMLEAIIRTVAARNGRDPNIAFQKVRKAIIRLFETDVKAQALEHTRHRIKRSVEYHIDGRFSSITSLEEHVAQLPSELNTRGIYEQLCRDFRSYVSRGSYRDILRVYNRKSMLNESHVADACGIRYGDRKAYTRQVLNILKKGGEDAQRIIQAVKECFNLEKPASPPK